MGTVVDVFVARKRNRSGRKFGFVRFLRVRDVGKMEQDLNSCWLDKFKLKANLAKYGRKDERAVEKKPQKLKSIIVGSQAQGREHPDNSSAGASRRVRSYSDAVYGNVSTSPPHAIGQARDIPTTCEVHEPHSIQVIPSCDSLERLSRSLVGQVRCLEVLKNFQEFLTVEGLNDVKVRYYGGLAILLEFRMKIAAKNYLFLARATWSKWFRELDCWSTEAQPMKRFASLNIVGVPLC
ncbi:hypothetical protein LXL04_032071 [Taraxacum kok-saghyz]